MEFPTLDEWVNSKRKLSVVSIASCMIDGENIPIAENTWMTKSELDNHFKNNHHELYTIGKIEQKQKEDFEVIEQKFRDGIADLSVGIDETFFKYDTRCMELMGAM